MDTSKTSPKYPDLWKDLIHGDKSPPFPRLAWKGRNIWTRPRRQSVVTQSKTNQSSQPDLTDAKYH